MPMAWSALKENVSLSGGLAAMGGGDNLQSSGAVEIFICFEVINCVDNVIFQELMQNRLQKFTEILFCLFC